MTYQQARDEAAELASRKYSFEENIPIAKLEFTAGSDWARRHTLMSDEVKAMREALERVDRSADLNSEVDSLVVEALRAYDKLVNELNGKYY